LYLIAQQEILPFLCISFPSGCRPYFYLLKYIFIPKSKNSFLHIAYLSIIAMSSFMDKAKSNKSSAYIYELKVIYFMEEHKLHRFNFIKINELKEKIN